MDEPRRHVARRQRRGAADDQIEQPQRIVRFLAIQVAQHIAHRRAHALLVLQIGEPLERADTDMAAAQPHHDRRAGGGGLVAAGQILTRLDQRQRAAGRHVQRLQHLGRQYFAHPALQRQSAIAEAAVRGLSRSLGAKVHQPPGTIPHLRKGEAAPVADLRVVLTELVTVIAQRQRLRQRAGQGHEPSETPGPFRVVERVEPDLARRGIVAKAQGGLGKVGGRHRVPEGRAEIEQGSLGAVCLRVDGHVWIWRSLPRPCNPKDPRLWPPMMIATGRRPTG
jgi:hypothetical protein